MRIFGIEISPILIVIFVIKTTISAVVLLRLIRRRLKNNKENVKK